MFSSARLVALWRGPARGEGGKSYAPGKLKQKKDTIILENICRTIMADDLSCDS